VFTSTMHSISSCLTLGGQTPSRSDIAARISDAALRSSRVPRSTISSSISMPRLERSEERKSICTAPSLVVGVRPN